MCVGLCRGGRQPGIVSSFMVFPARSLWFQGARGRENFKVCFPGGGGSGGDKEVPAMSDVAQRPGEMRLRIDHGISDPGVIGTLVRAVWAP